MPQFFGDNRFKFGLFGINCSGGMTASRAPERWRADWGEIVKAAQLADEAGVEFMLPIAKWRGLGGEANMWGRSFETFTQAAALGALTRNIGIFVTAHVSLITPAFAAKAMATIDHATDGRAGLNIVCGWNPDEFSPHGVKIDAERRYDRGLEWFQIYSRLLEGGPEFDWDGAFYQMEKLQTDPLPVQKPRPPVMSAAQSGDGQKFAAQAADLLFTTVQSPEEFGDTIQPFRNAAAAHGRNPDIYVQTQLVCKPTRKEAEEYVHYFAVEMADPDAIEYFNQQRAKTLSGSALAGQTKSDRTMVAIASGAARRRYPGMFAGMYPLIGTPDDLVAGFERLAAQGVAGSAMVFLNYLDEMPYFVQEVFPRMERVGLRSPVRKDA